MNRSSKEDVFRTELLGRVQQAEQQTNTPAPEPTAEGLRAISKDRHKDLEPGPEKEDPEQKLRIDKKKLILYSEILKPKFDA